jgi:hypothetical protein
MGFTGGGEGGPFFMAHMDPVDFFLGTERVGKAVQGIPDNAVNPLYPDPRECLRHIGRSRACHPDLSPDPDLAYSGKRTSILDGHAAFTIGTIPACRGDATGRRRPAALSLGLRPNTATRFASIRWPSPAMRA